ncbi:10544_t:CDS:1, partial [Acaulospora colombiana]
ALQTKPKAERGIFSRGPSMQYSATGTVSEEAFSQETAETTDPLFDKPLKSAKLSTSTYHTASQPLQEDQVDVTQNKGKGSFGGWNDDEGFTAGWLSKGNDTLGENAMRMQVQQQHQRVPGAFEGEDEEQYDESAWSPDQDEDVTNHQWARIKAQGDDEGSQSPARDGDNETTSHRSDLEEDADEEVETQNDEDMAVDEEELETQSLGSAAVAAPIAPARG